MKVLIVAKTRMGSGACVGGITADGHSVRLIADDVSSNDHFNQAYILGDVWDVTYTREPKPTPPHVENVLVSDRRKLRHVDNVVPHIEQFMPPAFGPVELLFENMLQVTKAGAQYIAERSGVPSYSTMFWRPDRPLQRIDDGKRIRYAYPTPAGNRTLTYVGFQDPVPEIPAGTLLRVSLAHWWRPKEMVNGELRCYVQLSGWYELTDQHNTAAPFVPERIPSLCDINGAQDVLQRVFGHKTFRPLQADIISNILRKRDTLVVMPTGSGKSMCYQVPALLFAGLSVVVSPLISLMEDQVAQLRQHGVAAEFLNSSLTYEQYTSVVAKVRFGEVKLLYAAPETLLRPETLLLLSQCPVDCLTIDEAHCISQWGHDFRPEYRQLLSLREQLPDAVCLAVTATATARVRGDIKRTLQIGDADEFVASFDRRNLFLAAAQKTEPLEQITSFLADHRGDAGIIYCNTKKEVGELVRTLSSDGWPVLPYHADLTSALRRENQSRFIHEDALIMVATIAFGMGINKSNVRFVVHNGLPKNLENYYQQVGRAGRDGFQADCLLLYEWQDIYTSKHFINQQAPSEQAGAHSRLQAMLRFAESVDCRRPSLLSYFGETFDEAGCQMCDNCLAAQDHGDDDITVPAQKFLSCVKRTGEMFGAAHIVSVLRGSRSQRVRKWRHDQLSTYNIGREFSKRQWMDLYTQFLQLGLLRKDHQHGSLHLTDSGEQVLRGESVYGRLNLDDSNHVQRDEEFGPKAYDAELFELLREKRRQLAIQHSVAPFMIFHDSSLIEMATVFPCTESDFARISGVGTVKLQRYAPEFLPIIIDYCRLQGAAGSVSPDGARGMR